MGYDGLLLLGRMRVLVELLLLELLFSMIMLTRFGLLLLLSVLFILNYQFHNRFSNSQSS